jgi:transcriptional regulator with XRE-family HTH domain
MNAVTELRQVIAERLRELMAASPDLDTQVKLAHRSGMSQSSVARILSADSSATVDSIANLARAFGIPPASLLLSNKVDVELLLTSQGLTAEGRQRLLGYAAALSAGQHFATAAPNLSNDSPVLQADARQKMPPTDQTYDRCPRQP